VSCGTSGSDDEAPGHVSVVQALVSGPDIVEADDLDGGVEGVCLGKGHHFVHLSE
jgi:hypothetical protein